MTTTYEFNDYIYSITDEAEGKFVVIKTNSSPDANELFMEKRCVEAESAEKVKLLIWLGKYTTFEKI